MTQSVTSLHPPVPFHCSLWNMWLISSQPLFFSNFFSEHSFFFFVLNETGHLLLMLHSRQNSRVETLFASVFLPLGAQRGGRCASYLPPPCCFQVASILPFQMHRFFEVYAKKLYQLHPPHSITSQSPITPLSFRLTGVFSPFLLHHIYSGVVLADSVFT